jgi:hypothetical protein
MPKALRLQFQMRFAATPNTCPNKGEATETRRGEKGKILHIRATAQETPNTRSKSNIGLNGKITGWLAVIFTGSSFALKAATVLADELPLICSANRQEGVTRLRQAKAKSRSAWVPSISA